MSIWTDMIKYRAKNEEFFYDVSSKQMQEHLYQIENQEPTLEYVEFFKFMPKLDGQIQFRIDTKTVGSGYIRRITIVLKQNNSIIFESEELTGDWSNIFQVKAFNQYSIEFKNNIVIGGVPIPDIVNLVYGTRNKEQDIQVLT